MNPQPITSRPDERLEMDDGDVHHISNLRSDSWLRFFALPHGTQFEVRDDLNRDHYYDGCLASDIQHLAGRTFVIDTADVDTERPVQNTQYAVQRQEHTIPEDSEQGVRRIQASDYYFTLLLMSRVRLPSGVVFELPWHNVGTSPFATAPTPFDQPAAVALGPITATIATPLSPTMFAALLPGSLIVDKRQGYVYLVMTRANADGVITVHRATHNPDPAGLVRIFTELIANNAAVTSITLDLTLQIYGAHVGTMPVPTPPQPVTLTIDQIRPGDVIELRTGGSTHFMGVRWAGNKHRTGTRTVRGIYTNSAREAVVAMYNTALARVSMGEFSNSNNYIIRRVEYVAPPAGWVVPADMQAMTVQDALALGLTLENTHLLDAWDLQRFLTALTPEAVANLVAAGITSWNVFHYSAAGVIGISELSTGVSYSYPRFVGHTDGANGAISIISTEHAIRGSAPSPLMNTHGAATAFADPFCLLTNPTLAHILAYYYPEKRVMVCGYTPYEWTAAQVPYLREAFTKIGAWCREMHGQMESGEIRARVEEYRFNAQLTTYFGLTRLPRTTELMFGNKIIELRACREGETPEVVLLGQGYRVRQTVEDIPRRAKAIFHVVDGEAEVAKRLLEQRLRTEFETRATPILNGVIEPTTAALNQMQRRFNESTGQQMNEITQLNNRLKADVAGLGGLITHHAKMYDILGGLMAGILPAGWYARVAPGGFMEACVDEVQWTDISTEVPVVTPVKLRVRAYYSNDNKRWQTIVYSESEHIIGDRSFYLHPHITGSGAVTNESFPGHTDMRATPGYTAPYCVNFCFGAASVSAPSHAQFPVFFTQMRDYISAIQRVLTSVLSSGGYGLNTQFTAYAVASGYATSSMELPAITRKIGMSHAQVTAMTSSVETHIRRMAEYTSTTLAGRAATPTSEGVTTVVS